MSLLRQRASDASVESTLSARRPAEARAWFVSVRSWCSDVELKVVGLQASAARGTDSSPRDDIPNAMAISRTRRRGSRARLAVGAGRREARAGATIIEGRSRAGPAGGRVWIDRRRAAPTNPRREGPALPRTRVPRRAPQCVGGQRTVRLRSRPHRTSPPGGLAVAAESGRLRRLPRWP